MYFYRLEALLPSVHELPAVRVLERGFNVRPCIRFALRCTRTRTWAICTAMSERNESTRRESVAAVRQQITA